MVDENQAQIDKYDGLARKALAAGNEDDARTFLAKKQELVGKNEGALMAYEAAHENAQKMRQMHDKLVNDINTLKGRRDTIKAKAAVAKTKEKVSKMTGGADRAESAISAFERMEAKTDAMLDKSEAMEELDAQPEDPVTSLEEKYAASGASAAVDDELAALKKEMGL